jgi:hypothetical protein
MTRAKEPDFQPWHDLLTGDGGSRSATLLEERCVTRARSIRVAFADVPAYLFDPGGQSVHVARPSSICYRGPPGTPQYRRKVHHDYAFFCLHGALQMFVSDGYLTLEPGDFLHIPPGTIHSFKLLRNDTRFIGFLSPGNFESFFRYLCQPYDGHVYPLVPPPLRFDRVLEHMRELDLHLLGRPGGPPPTGAA